MKAPLAAALALLVCACATVPREHDPAVDIQRFLIAIRDGDRAAFDYYVNRDALKTQLRSRVLAEAGRQGQQGQTMNAIGALLATPLVGIASDALIQPEVFRAIAERRGFRAEMGMPEPGLISRFVRPIGGDAVCVVFKSDGPCQLIFRNEGGVYRLVGYEGELTALMPGRS